MNLPKGRGLDWLLARDVARLPQLRAYEGEHRPLLYWKGTPNGGWWAAVPWYSTDLKEAWELFKQFRKEASPMFASLDEIPGGHWVFILQYCDPLDKGYVGEGVTECLAICHCLLSAAKDAVKLWSGEPTTSPPKPPVSRTA